MVDPVVKLDRSLAKKTAALAISTGSAKRPNGIVEMRAARNSSTEEVGSVCAARLSLPGVAVDPGRCAGSGDSLDKAKLKLVEDLGKTYATAFNDLLSSEEGTIERAPGVLRALSRQLFSRTPALSASLETGSS